jgi:hypothetical protein
MVSMKVSMRSQQNILLVLTTIRTVNMYIQETCRWVKRRARVERESSLFLAVLERCNIKYMRYSVENVRFKNKQI